jgi:hypothetical protein
MHVSIDVFSSLPLRPRLRFVFPSDVHILELVCCLRAAPHTFSRLSFVLTVGIWIRVCG